MKIAAYCIKHKVTTILAFIMVAIFGVVFYSNLKLALMPNMEFPMAYVMCTYVGATPEDMEELVTRPLESCIATISGVDTIQSTSAENMSAVIITYDKDTDVDTAANKLREKFDLLSLPDGCSDPIIYNLNINEMMPVAVISLTGSDLNQLQNLAENSISPALERIEGVANTNIMGGISNQIAVDVNPTMLTGYGLSINDISNYLAAANVLYPGGDVDNGANTLTATTNGKYRTVEDVANTMIFLPRGGTVRLSEIANVYIDTDLARSSAKVDGSSCVIISVSKSSGANEVEVANKITAAMEEIGADNPSLEYNVVYDGSEYIMHTADNAIHNIVLGILLSAIVVFAFLRRPGATFTISLSMPFCVLVVFLMMNVAGITLNMMSLGGMALGIGMVVDNSIVVLENIYRYAGDGYSKYDSCVLGATEVFNSITASTLTTVAVFLPIGLSGGTAGMMFKDLSLTIVFLILASLIIAMTLVPLLCYFLLDEKKVRLQRLQRAGKVSRLAEITGRMGQTYRKVLRFFIRRRIVAVIISVALVVFFMGACAGTNMVMIPEMDQGVMSIRVNMPTGTEMEQTVAYGDRVVAIAQEHIPEIDTLYMTVSGGASIFGNGESASITINLVDKSERDRSSKEICDDIEQYFADIAGCEIDVSSSSSMGGYSSGSLIDVVVQGADYDILAQLSNELMKEIDTLEDATNLETSLETEVPAVKISVNHTAAAQYGLTSATIGAAVRAELTGVTATTVTIDNKDFDVVVQGSGVNASSLDALRSMPVAAPTGGTVPLSAVANVSVELSPQSIIRKDQVRQVEITGDSISGNTTEITEQVQEILDNFPMPDGYTAEIAGSYTEMMENFHSLFLAMIVAVGLVYFILAAQFGSFVMPVMIMLILPFALSGALFGLPLTGNDLSMVVILAMIVLVGTVVNSSIVLIDYINIRRQGGLEKNEAILEACPLRIRPILMTTLTTVLALVPMATGIGGSGNELMEPMGITMISGMIISTIVTLFFTPVYYSLLDSLTDRIQGPMRKRRARKDAKLQKLIDELEAAEEFA